MKIEEIKNAISTRKGSNVRAIWTKNLKTRKGVTDIVEKVTSLVVRGGIDYENLKAVQDGRENGSLPSENVGLPWGEWAEFPYHITHKGQEYARFYPASGNDIATGEAFVPHVEYFLNGNPVEKKDIQEICLASEFSEKKFILTDISNPYPLNPKTLTREQAQNFVDEWNDISGSTFKSPEDFICPLFTLVKQKDICWTIKVENVRSILV